MDIKTYLEGLDWSPLSIIKLVGIVLGALFVASLVLSILSTVSPGAQSVSIMPQIGGYAEEASYDYAVSDGYAGGFAGAPTLSVRNTAAYPPQPYPGGTVGDEAESLEVMQYHVAIRTGDGERDCTALNALKEKDYVIFESANTYERGCSLTFKVAKAHVDEIVSIIEEFDPEEFSEQVYTIAQTIKDYTSEEEILRAKLDTVTKTLESATDAYDDITALAIRTQDADALARVIESKLSIIERLTQERINVSAQLDRLSRAKALELDRLDYTYFTVQVSEERIVNGEYLAEMWRAAASATVQDVNRILTEVTLGLVALFFLVSQWLIYGALLFVIAKVTWRYGKRFWQS